MNQRANFWSLHNDFFTNVAESGKTQKANYCQSSTHVFVTAFIQGYEIMLRKFEPIH